jgi:hypothetical protein
LKYFFRIFFRRYGASSAAEEKDFLFCRYGASSATDDEHPDLKENDIDIVIAVENEEEWGRLQQQITKAGY